MDGTDSGLSKEQDILSNLICPICSFCATSQSSMICHLTNVHKEQLVAVCKICQQLFPSNVISAHALNCKGSYPCPICRSTFALPSYLRRHLNRHHKKTRRPVCETCYKEFSSTDALLTHKRLHEGDYPYTCELCSGKFAQKNHLKLHIDSHHAYVELNDQSKPFVCKTCGREFLYMVSLQQHRLQHIKLNIKKNFVCKFCDKAFSYQSELQRHSVIHSKIAPHQCPFCARSFTRSNLLKTHILRHTDPSILTCCYCSRTYASRSYLLQHMQRHERDLQTPSVSSLSTSSFTDLNALSDDYESGCFNESTLTKMWDDSVSVDLNYVHSVPPNVNYLHAVLYGQNT